MSLANFTDLETAIANWLARAGDMVIAANAADFIALCEARLAYGADAGSLFPSRPLRIRAMETPVPLVIKAANTGSAVGGTANAVTLTPTGIISSYALGDTYSFTAAGTNTGLVTVNVAGLGAVNVVKGSASAALAGGEIVGGATFQIYYNGTNFVLLPGSANVPLPPGWLSARSFYLDTNPRQDLDFVTPSALNRQWAGSIPGKPQEFTIEADAIRFGPQPDGIYYGWTNYYQKIPALATASTNWLMTNAPNVYLNGALLEATIYIDQGLSDRVKFFGSQFVSACNGLQAQDDIDRHSGAVLTMRTDTGNP